MLIETDLNIGNEQAKIFAQYVYDDFIEFIKSQDNDNSTDNKNNIKLEVN